MFLLAKIQKMDLMLQHGRLTCQQIASIVRIDCRNNFISTSKDSELYQEHFSFEHHVHQYRTSTHRH